jgi:hypothetical protein
MYFTMALVAGAITLRRARKLSTSQTRNEIHVDFRASGCPGIGHEF